MSRVRLIAVYLPQFHQISENDRWWGKGFTEWFNVCRARPLFSGHVQPRIPTELGYYDLTTPGVIGKQASLAQEYGIEGFCFWHYWFNGKLLLERPIIEYLKDSSITASFCMAWANENWSRKWNGSHNELIQWQSYGVVEEDAIAHFHYLLPMFQDSRYMTIDDRKVFMFYKPHDIPRLTNLVKIWRDLARSNGLSGLYLVGMGSEIEHTSSNMPQPDTGLDAELQFQPAFTESWQFRQSKQKSEYVSDRGAVIEYDQAWKLMLRQNIESGATYSSVVPGWDNTPRMGIDAHVLSRPCPELYGRWLQFEVERQMERRPDQRVVFINAWNEWAEGNYLEPDLHEGRAYLEATLHALNTPLSVTEIAAMIRTINRLDSCIGV